MKKLVILSTVLFATLASCTSVTVGNKSDSLKTETDSVSNAIGLLLGAQIRSTNVELNKTVVYNAIEQILSASDEEMEELTKNELNAANEFFRNYMMVILPAKKIADGEKFLESISKKENVKKTESGIYYEIIEEGDLNAKANNDQDTVEVHYVGTKINGDEFDSSVKRGEPAIFPLNRVIKGWTEGMQLVGKGGKIKLYIPSELGYGERGELANEVLIFDVDLLNVMPFAEKK